METVDWDISKGIWVRNSKNTVTNRYVAMTIGGDETSATGSVGRKGIVREEVGLLVRSRSLGTIVKVCSKTIEVAMTNFIDGVFS
jgi:hypothetical protein